MTDIDDTLLPSGEFPTKERLDEISRFIEILKRHDILWIPMSGVAMKKIGPRILHRLPEELFSHILYYGGDGSLKYIYDEANRKWYEDPLFAHFFSDAQSYRILGELEFAKALEQLSAHEEEERPSVGHRIDEARRVLVKRGYPLGGAILEILKGRLPGEGLDPDHSETYFHGGSISWMMLGDIRAESYHEPGNCRLRKELIKISERWLWACNYLEDLGPAGVSVPFSGVRGIKFILKGNGKERSARELMSWAGLAPEQLLYAGTELYEGGNGNMLRNIEGITLLSVGGREDPESLEVPLRMNQESGIEEGVGANLHWMKKTAALLEAGVEWSRILEEAKEGIRG